MKKVIVILTVLFSVNSYALGTLSPKNNPLEKYVCGTLTGTFDLTTNNMFRGLSQSNNNPSVQGGLTYLMQYTGVYFNLFGTSVDEVDAQGRQATVELDTTVGVANKIGENASYDISLARYNFPKASGLNYNELIGVATYRFLVGKIGYSSNVYNVHKTGIYYEGGVNMPIPPPWAFSLTNVIFQAAAGHYSLPRSAGLNSYNNYSLLLSKAIANYVLSIQWTGTNGRSRQGSLARNQLVGSVLVNF